MNGAKALLLYSLGHALQFRAVALVGKRSLGTRKIVVLADKRVIVHVAILVQYLAHLDGHPFYDGMV